MGIVVLDKCFLQAARWETVCSLAKQNDLIVTGSLFHELLTGDPVARHRAFAKLPRRDNPVRLLDNLSSLLAHEERTHKRAGNVLDHTIDIAFRFNPNLKEPGYELPQEAANVVAENTASTRRLVELYVDRTNAVSDMFHRVTTGSDQERDAALKEIGEEISKPENVLIFYRSVAVKSMPPGDLLTEDWATFRFYQTSMLFSLHTLHRHRGLIPAPLSENEFERLEHDVHDHIVLCAGILAGGLASNETKLKEWCTLLCPSTFQISS